MNRRNPHEHIASEPSPPDPDQSTPGTTQRCILTYLTSPVCFLFGLVIGYQIWAPLQPSVYTSGVAASLDYFAANKDKINVVLLGSSRTRRGIDPRTFDQEMKSFGFDITSFNLGFNGCWNHEANALIEKLLAAQPKRLKSILIESTVWDASIVDENVLSRRTIWWHSFTETVSVLRSVYLLDEPILERLRLAYLHLLHMATRYGRVSLGLAPLHRLLLQNFGSERDQSIVTTRDKRTQELVAKRRRALDARRGYASFNMASPKHAAKHAHFVNKLYPLFVRNLLPRLRGSPPAPVSFEHYNVNAIRSQIARLKKAGVTPIYFTPPDATRRDHVRQLAQLGVIEHYFGFNDPDTYAELYTREARYDRAHLTYKGSQMFTKLLARRFAAHLRNAGID